MDTSRNGILTPDQRLRVFISSTLRELAAERGAARAAIESMRMHPILFELGARAHPPRDLYRAYLDQSDIFVGIYWQSYGWIAPEMSVSGLEDEYLLSEDKPRLIYIKDPAPERESALSELLERIRAGGSVTKMFTGTAELESMLSDDLAVMLTESFTSSSGVLPPAKPQLKTRYPMPAASLVGRATELADIADLLTNKDARLVTATGPGGVGKSKLALELGPLVKDHFADGIHFVALETLERADEVPSTIGASLGLVERLATADPVETLFRALADKDVLLVLDNFEHVRDAGGFITDLLSVCPKVKILVTSRAVLRLRSEVEYPIKPLDVDGVGGGETDAVKLFMERARNTAFAGSPQQMEAVHEVCRHLDGLPLAIELAAARTSLLQPTQLLAHMTDRFSLLRGGGADFPERQKTMRSAIAWSVDLLSEEDRIFFRRLGVFIGGFTLDAALEVCDPADKLRVLDHMQTLIENSLITTSSGGLDPRFTMLESVRDFACDLLTEAGEEPETGLLYSEHYLELALDAAAGLRSSHQVETLNLIESEEDNINRAFDRLFAQGRIEDVARGAYALWPFAWIRGRGFQTRSVMDRVLNCDAEISELWHGRALAAHGAMSLFIGDHGVAVPSLLAAIDELAHVDDQEGVGLCQVAMGLVSSVLEPETTMVRLREAVANLKAANEAYGTAIALNSLCWMDLSLDLDVTPVETFEEAIAASQQIGSMVEVAISTGNYGWRLAREDRVEGLLLLRRAFVMLVDGDMVEGVSYLADGLAEILVMEGEDEEAIRMFGISDALVVVMGVLSSLAGRVRRERLISEITERIGASAVKAALRSRSNFSYSECVAAALATCDRLEARLRTGTKDGEPITA